MSGFLILPDFEVHATGTAKGVKVWTRLYHYFHLHQDEFLSRYHQRSNVESLFSSLKRKFNGTVMCRNETARFNEGLAKLLCHNLCVLIKESYLNDTTLEIAPILAQVRV